MLFGYCRVSTEEQNLDRQIVALKDFGVKEENIYCDKISGVKDDRPQLSKLKSFLREGDTVVILSFDRLARSTKMLLDWAEWFEGKGVNLISLKEKIDTTTPQGKLFFTISAAFSQFEREMIKQRQAEGIRIAKANGKMKGRPKVDEAKLDAAIALYMSGDHSVKQIQEITGISRSTLYRELSNRDIER